MRILHLSDLHFGAHNSNLKDNLEVRVKALRPNMIVATGDLADQPDKHLLKEASDYLQGLAKHCVPSRTNVPTLLVVPGNHDVKDWGLFGLSTSAYDDVFKATTHFYDEEENVWLYGLNSSGRTGIGANGFIHADDLVLFDSVYQQLKGQHKTRFEEAYKIVLLHHHPLPIKYDAKHQRWLTLENSGEFLGEMLKHQVDLVLHGHEHVQARCKYWRALRNTHHRQVQTVAVGATLKNNESNWFQLITVEKSGEVRLEVFGADGSLFDEKPEPIALKSLPEAREQVFGQWISRAGYHCRKVASVTILKRDGDAHRIVECEDLEIFNETIPRAKQHIVRLGTTAGYIDLPRAEPLKDAPVGLSLQASPRSTERSIEAVITYGQLTHAQRISYRYDWWAVNAFAMDERELRLKYTDGLPPVEFTYYRVEDPIDELVVIVQFPASFPRLPHLDVFVGRPSDITQLSGWEHEPGIEARLRSGGALQYVDALKMAALRVRQPEEGWYYGIQWKLPSSPSRASGPKSGQIVDLVNKLLGVRDTADPRSDMLSLLLRSLADLVREKLLPGWHQSLEVSIAVLDERNRKMLVVAAANVDPPPSAPSPLQSSTVQFDYGEGIVGKAFKTNEYRLYVRVPREEREEPDFYRERLGSRRHEVLLAIPVQNPDESQQVYAVLNFGSSSAGCPLRDLASPSSVTLGVLRSLQEAINKSCFDFLTEAWQ